MKSRERGSAAFVARRVGKVASFSFGPVLLIVLIAGGAWAQMTADDIAALQREGAAQGWTFTTGENPATFLPRQALCGLVEPDQWRALGSFEATAPLKTALPSSFDWRTSGALTPIRDQASCGSCWAFATVGVVESAIKIHDSATVDLSEQWLVSCNTYGWGCDGGWFAYDFFQDHPDPCGGTGAVMEANFPYTATDARCRCPYPHRYLIDSWAYIGNSGSIPSVAAIKQAILDHGPVGCAIYAGDAFQAYTGGVFNHNENIQVNHAVVLIGWDDNQGASGVWLLRNSWGPWWGEDGYMRIEYGCSKVGYAANFVRYSGVVINPTPTNSYRVTYTRGGKPSDAFTFTDAAIIIAPGGGDNDTLKIKKLSPLMPETPVIPTVSSPAGLKKVYTEAPIDSLKVAGLLASLTASGCSVADVVTSETGAVKMTAKPNSSDNGDYLFTTIASFSPTPANGKRFKTAAISLSGVILANLSTPFQAATVSASSKKYGPSGASYVSAGGIGIQSSGGVPAGGSLGNGVSRVAAAWAPKISVKGGSINVNDIVTTPGVAAPFYPAGAAKTVSKIAAQSGVFSLASEGEAFKYALAGDVIIGGAIAVESPLRVSAKGGNVAVPFILSARGIAGVSATLFKYKDSGDTITEGGFVGLSLGAPAAPRFGSYLDAPTTMALVVSGLRSLGVAQDAGIGSVHGDRGVSGVFYAGGARQADGFAPACVGKISSISTLSVGDHRLPGDETPVIAGEAQAATGTMPTFKGDTQHTGFQVLHCE